MNTIQNRPTFERHQNYFACGLVVVGRPAENGQVLSVMASSFNSVSLSPRLVMWCVWKGDGTVAPLAVGVSCGLSVLAADHRGLWPQCRQAGAAHEFKWQRGDTLDVPLVDGAAACFEVSVTLHIDQGDHDLYVGEVASFAYSASCGGLLSYLDRVRVPCLQE